MLEIKYINTIDLIPYVNNTRTHDDKQVTQIASSIKEFGFTNPILIDESNEIIAGHGRLLAAQKLNLVEIPCIVLIGLSKAQKKAYVIADNKLALNAGWNEELLKIEIADLKELDFNIDLLGFTEEELKLFYLESEQLDYQGDEDSVPEEPKNIVSVLGDVWILGNHRLMCGDSTSIDNVDKLMNGNKVDIIFTDPPYNVAFNGRSGKHDVIKNDNMEVNDFNNFINEVMNTIKTIDCNIYYIWCNWKFYGILQGQLPYKSCIVWAKNVFGLGNNYRHQHEFCLFNGDIDKNIKNESDLWQVKKDHSYVHPTQKPVELSERAFNNHTTAKNVLDLFGGSGSTLIGAIKTNKTAFIMELDEKYVDVIIKRWQDYTGKEAILESTGESFNNLYNIKYGK